MRQKIGAALFVSERMLPLIFVFHLSFRVVINFTSKYLSRQYCLSRQIVTFLISAGDRAEEEVAHEKDCLDHPLVDIYIMMQFCLFVTKNEHFFCWFSWVIKVVSWFFMVFGWFPWFFKVVSWFLVGFHGFSR